MNLDADHINITVMCGYEKGRAYNDKVLSVVKKVMSLISGLAYQLP